jgi:hypothetical protein
MQPRTVKLAGLAMALIAAGCGSLLGRPNARLTLIDIPVHHVHGMPDDVKTTWYRAYVLKTNSLGSGEAIKVGVRGEVGKVSSISVPRGTTVLEAIKMAGGFTEFALPRKVIVVNPKHHQILSLHRQRRGLLRRSLVWLGDGSSDFVLEPDTTIGVSRGW